MKALAAIFLHFVGFYVVDSLMPEWVEAAGAWLLAKWYFAFFMVDFVAMAVAGRSCVNYLLAISATWSLLLAVEQMLLNDQLQQADATVQLGLDIVIGLYAGLLLILLVAQKRARMRGNAYQRRG
jgi:hypothetical protein